MDDQNKYSKHKSVLKNECIQFLSESHLNTNQEAHFADLTFGGGGHSITLVKLNPLFRVFSVDQDPEALANGAVLIEKNNIKDSLTLIDSNFENFPERFQKIMNENNKIKGLDGILMDLGVSSHHFDSADRGFSFRFEGPLDMRMNNRESNTLTAETIVNTFSVEELENIFREYGEEKFSKRIAEKIVEVRATSELKTTKDLENIIFHCYPRKMRFGKAHPATKCFQALRIFINRELDVLSDVIPQLMPMLNPGGRICIISFHSMEDRIVKNQFKMLSKAEIRCKILTKRPIAPTNEEIKENPRSRSAKLRVIERL